MILSGQLKKSLNVVLHAGLVVVEKNLEWPTYPRRYDAITSRTGVLGETIAQPANSLLSPSPEFLSNHNLKELKCGD